MRGTPTSPRVRSRVAMVSEVSELRVRTGRRWEQLRVACAQVLSRLYSAAEPTTTRPADQLLMGLRGADAAGIAGGAAQTMTRPESRPAAVAAPGGGASKLTLMMLDKLVAVEPRTPGSQPQARPTPLSICIIQKNGMLVQTAIAAAMRGGHKDEVHSLLASGSTSTGHDGRGSFPWNAIYGTRRAELMADPRAELARAEATLANRSWLKIVVLRYVEQLERLPAPIDSQRPCRPFLDLSPYCLLCPLCPLGNPFSPSPRIHTKQHPNQQWFASSASPLAVAAILSSASSPRTARAAC